MAKNLKKERKLSKLNELKEQLADARLLGNTQMVRSLENVIAHLERKQKRRGPLRPSRGSQDK